MGHIFKLKLVCFHIFISNMLKSLIIVILFHKLQVSHHGHSIIFTNEVGNVHISKILKEFWNTFFFNIIIKSFGDGEKFLAIFVNFFKDVGFVSNYSFRVQLNLLKRLSIGHFIQDSGLYTKYI